MQVAEKATYFFQKIPLHVQDLVKISHTLYTGPLMSENIFGVYLEICD